MTMSDAQGWAYLITTVITLIAALFGAKKASDAKVDTTIVKEKQEHIVKKQDSMASQVDIVEVNTNSRAERQDRQIETLLQSVEGLKLHIAEQDKTRALLAAEVRQSVVIPAPLTAPAEFTVIPEPHNIILLPGDIPKSGDTPR